MSQNTNNSARQAALARRIALSTSGKAALSKASADTATTSIVVSSAANSASTAIATSGGSARKAALARRIAMSKGGKRSVANTDRTRNESASVPAAVTSQKAKDKPSEDCGCGCKKESTDISPETVTSSDEIRISAQLQSHQGLVRKLRKNSVRAAALSRRKALSTKGKSALKGGAVSAASAARASNPDMSSRELAKILRTERSAKGKTSNKDVAMKPTGPRRRAASQEAPVKVGESDTASGQTITGTMVDRKNDVTGNEASTCRGITGTEYMGADVFKDYCQADAKPAFNRVSVTSTGAGNSISGVKVGRSSQVTGDEPGSCKTVTGNEYLSAEQVQKFCGADVTAAPSKFSIAETAKGKKVSGNNVGQEEKVTGNDSGADRSLTGTQYMQRAKDSAPAKVAVSKTLRGGSVTGQHIGRSGNVTGDESGSCRNVTGDDYVGLEQYDTFCKSTPAANDKKVGMTNTLTGKSLTGTMTGRSEIVTGNESGTCEAVTGTPYVSQSERFCSSNQMSIAAARNKKGIASAGASMTGTQPGVAGAVTGAEKGACEPLTGTPYIGADQLADVCPAIAAQPGSSDFPQALGVMPWNQFSVASPAAESQIDHMQDGITGCASANGKITGPFGMASGKLTGTEEARFGKAEHQVAVTAMSTPATAEMIDGRVKSRISGEGMSSGIRISGDDWDRGDHVTGTEGLSAVRRNQTIRSSGSIAMSASVPSKRNDEIVVPVSKVTGGSGNTEQGAFVTYSGGARG